jgi:hypothetical protein
MRYTVLVELWNPWSKRGGTDFVVVFYLSSDSAGDGRSFDTIELISVTTTRGSDNLDYFLSGETRTKIKDKISKGDCIDLQ